MRVKIMAIFRKRLAKNHELFTSPFLVLLVFRVSFLPILLFIGGVQHAAMLVVQHIPGLFWWPLTHLCLLKAIR